MPAASGSCIGCRLWDGIACSSYDGVCQRIDVSPSPVVHREMLEAPMDPEPTSFSVKHISSCLDKWENRAARDRAQVEQVNSESSEVPNGHS